ncbi:SMI1/KNR4 family protein [Dactylosporangium sp. McL0621]|uniref:SMI1/KNR4 family protein n=1 Tax=Dactylosporangium sp. McL0621 TaxID=3415678 RepID=UPI003CF94DB1
MMTIMSWRQRIIEVTGARPEPRDIDWTPVEAELGTTLPPDYRELCSLLGDGYYSGFLRLLQPRGEAAATDGLLYSFRWNRRHPEYAGLYAPYDLYGGPGQPGLLGWGSDQTEGDYYWLADAEVDPAAWPVVARKDGIEPWHRYDMSMSEFIHHMLTDHGFEPFTVAATTARPFLLPEGVQIATVEEWNAWANRTDGSPTA